MNLAESMLGLQKQFFTNTEVLWLLLFPVKLILLILYIKSFHTETIKFEEGRFHKEVLPLFTQFYFDFIVSDIQGLT